MDPGDESARLEARRRRAHARAGAAEPREPGERQAAGGDPSPTPPERPLGTAPPGATARSRRRPRLLIGAVVGSCLLAAGGAAAASILLPREGAEPAASAGGPPASASAPLAEAPSVDALGESISSAVKSLAVVPSEVAVERAEAYARRRGGLVSFAAVDSSGQLVGSRDMDRRYVCASVVKAMLLAAELNRLEAEGLELDESTAATLEAMITYSDNAAADEIYYRVGDEGLNAVADVAGMERFTVAGYWANAQITAADMARMFSRLREVMAGPERAFALDTLASVVPEQSWGVPQAVGKRYSVRFKGGWRTTELGWLTHQAAELRGASERISLAVLTDGQPSMEHAIGTIEGITRRLIAGSS